MSFSLAFASIPNLKNLKPRNRITYYNLYRQVSIVDFPYPKNNLNQVGVEIALLSLSSQFDLFLKKQTLCILGFQFPLFEFNH